MIGSRVAAKLCFAVWLGLLANRSGHCGRRKSLAEVPNARRIGLVGVLAPDLGVSLIRR
jgi:hypothetical protein